jgi:hypothetical protein
MVMPGWLQIIGWGSAGIMASVTLWSKVLRPAAVLIATLQTTIPLLSELNEAMKVTRALRETPDSYTILKEIVAQFRTNDGSSLRDAIDGLVDGAAKSVTASEENKASAIVLAAHVSAVKRLAEEDRAEAARLRVAVDLLVVKVDALTKIVDNFGKAAG